MSAKKPPFDPDKLYQRALSLHQAGKLHEAESLYKTLLSFFPGQAEVLTPLGTLLLQQGRHKEGIKRLKESLAVLPAQPAALYNLGVELQKQAKLEEALACYDQAIAMNPDDVEMHINRGNALKDLNRYTEASASYDLAVAIKPDVASAHWNNALTKIVMGEYEEGWRLYEWGWQCGERGSARNFPQPKWLGEQPIAGKKLLIHAEQGFGDFIQFCRYAPMVESLGATVILEAPAALVALASTLKGNFTIVEKGKDLPDFDMYCPIMSLPLAFKTTLETVPAAVPYLYANGDKQLEWQSRLSARTRPRVGLVWSGAIAQKNDVNRSIPLSTLAPMLQLPIEFHSLQKEIRADDKEILSNFKQIHLHQEDIRDFSDTAALAQAMDLIVSVDTSVAHLAGALGRPAWILVPYVPDYRWMLDRSDSPWYPTINLIRQPEVRNWESVIAEVTQRLKARFLA